MEHQLDLLHPPALPVDSRVFPAHHLVISSAYPLAALVTVPVTSGMHLICPHHSLGTASGSGSAALSN